MRLRDALEDLHTYTSEDPGFLDPEDSGPYAASFIAGELLHENPPALRDVPWSLAQMDEEE